MIGVYVNGQKIDTVGFPGGIQWSHQWPGGCWDASWNLGGISRTAASRLLRRGAEVRIYASTWPVWRGALDESGDGQGSFTARGYYREAERFLALDSSGVPTVSTGDAIAKAITDGWAVTHTGTPPAGVPSEEPQYLHQLLDLASTSGSVRWGVNALGEVFFAADPTEPTLIVTPGQPLMGRADDSYATHLYAYHYTALAGTPPVPSAPQMATASDAATAAEFGRSASFVDLRPLGVLTSGAASTILQGKLAKGRARIGFTSPMTLGWHQLLTRGGVPANPATVTAGQMVRVYGAINPDGTAVAGGTQDIVIGATSHEAGSRSITLTPVGMEPRNLSDILAVTPVSEVVS